MRVLITMLDTQEEPAEILFRKGGRLLVKIKEREDGGD
jgi:hypothetical protein